MLLLPPGGACTLIDDLSEVGPLFMPESTLCPNVCGAVDVTAKWDGSIGWYVSYEVDCVKPLGAVG